MIKSPICDILGIRYPIFQGGMAWIADANLAAAVSNAGGLGLISSINYGTEAVRKEIHKLQTWYWKKTLKSLQPEQVPLVLIWKNGRLPESK